MNVRPARVEDVPQVLPLVDKVCAFHERLDPAKYGFHPDPGSMYEGWLERRATDERSVFLVADAGSGKRGAAARIVGFVVATVEADLGIYRLSEFGFVHDLWVDEDYRNEGLARQLVTLAIERFRDIGVQQVRLDVLVGNAAGRKLFETCGFRASTMEMLLEL